jgi:GTP-binding protein
MKITSAQFMRGVTGTNDILEDGVPQVAIIGRSNVGKSTIINSLTGQKVLARTSDFPGFTQEINVYWINRKVYLLDLPGYGFAKASRDLKERLQKLIGWYLFNSPYDQKKVLLIVDAFVGVTKDDIEMLDALQHYNKNIVIVANKIDKIPKKKYDEYMQKIRAAIGGQETTMPIIPYSSVAKIGMDALAAEILG